MVFAAVGEGGVMSWKGKAIGFLLGLLTRRPLLIAIGLLLGHLYDTGLFSRKRAIAPDPTTDPYVILGLSPFASEDEIEQTYRRLISDYHPDRVVKAAKEIRELAEKRAQEINGAYEEIKHLRGL